MAVYVLQVPSDNMGHLPEPAVQLWQKVVPLGLIFFCASFNLTILQVNTCPAATTKHLPADICNPESAAAAA